MTRRLLGLVGLLSTSLAFACHAPSRDDNAILMEGSADPAFTLADVRVGHGAIARDGDPVAAIESTHEVRGGAEQSWTFDREPDGDGDLVIDVPLAGGEAPPTADTHGGVRVRSGRGIVHYSAGTWVDAAGTRTRVVATPTATGDELRVSVDVVEASRYPAVFDPSVSSTIDVQDVT